MMTTVLFGQPSGVITYAEVTKLEINGVEGVDFGDMLPSEMSSTKALYFDSAASVYKDAEEFVREDIEMESDDGSFKMVIGTSETEEILFTDLNAKKSIQQTGFMGKEFLIESDLSKSDWKITSERIKYLGYVCQKATKTEVIEPMSGSDEGPIEREVVAWFTTEIPVSVGPNSYHQLPGAVLMVSVDDGKTEIKATEVDLAKSVMDHITRPTKGQKVSQDEFEKIMIEKMAEMQEMYGGDREGASFIIRG